MSHPMQSGARPANRLLQALPRAEYERLRPSLESVQLSWKDVLYEADTPIEHVYFIEEGVGSILARSYTESTVEVATIGNEGMVGIPLFLGADRNGTRAIVQVPGAAMRMTSAAFLAKVGPDSTLHHLLHQYTQTLMTQMAQGVLCNRLHAIDRRCARWLLQTRDRVSADEFALTQEFLGQMLGVRRQSVNVVQSLLQRAGLISYSRGSITILDRPGLEAASCECYAIIRDEFDRLFSLGNGAAGE